MLMDEDQKILNIFVVDDHPIVYNGLEMLLSKEKDLYICGHAESASETLKYLNKEKEPDLIIIDISLKGNVNGIDLLKTVKQRFPKIKPLVLSMHDEELYAERAIRAGAMGYLKKEELTTTIIKAIRDIASGNFFLSDKMSKKILNKLFLGKKDLSLNSFEKLSNREFEIFQFIGEGYSTSEIAKKLNVSVKTVDTHKYRMKNKLGLSSSSELIKLAVKHINQ